MTKVLNIKGYGQEVYDSFNGGVIWYQAVEAFNVPTSNPLEIAIVTGTENPTATPYGQFNSISNALDYYASAKCPDLLTSINATYGFSYYTSYNLQKVDPAVQTAIDLVGAKLVKSFANPTRTINTAFQISTTRDAEVTYSVDITCALSLSGGASGTITLEYADDSGMTTNLKTVSKGTNSNSGTLTIGLNLTQVGTAIISGIIPAGKYVKILTTNNTGTPTYSAITVQEVLI